MKSLGYYNGKIDELEKMQVPMLDRAFYFGDGVYDVTFSHNYRIFALDEHIDRLYRSAGRVGIVPKISKEELKELANRLIPSLENGNLWIYFQFSRGTAFRSHVPPANATPNLAIMMRPGEIRDVYRPMTCITLPDRRHRYCNVKSLNLMANILAKEKATQAGVDEAILHRGDYVTECSHSNLSIFKDGNLITHPEDEEIYAGSGRAHLISRCKAHGIPVEERKFSLRELFHADEVLLTSASALLSFVRTVDGTPVGGHARELLLPIQKEILEEFLKS